MSEVDHKPVSEDELTSPARISPTERKMLEDVEEQFLRRVAYFCASLAEWYEDEDVPDVLFSPQKLFGDRRPIDMLRTEE